MCSCLERFGGGPLKQVVDGIVDSAMAECHEAMGDDIVLMGLEC